jgi:hypothetical protein
VERTARAVDAFAALLEALPGGRQTLDAMIGEDAFSVRERREQMARQASFKANSFLFGHCCDTVSTSLFLSPSADGQRIDAVEIHRRSGLQRLSAAMTLPLLSVQAAASSPRATAAPAMQGLWGAGLQASDCFLPDGTLPLPDLAVLRDGPMSIFAIPPHAAVPATVTAGLRVFDADDIASPAGFKVVRNYMLHTPCRVLVREVFLAPGLWPDARPEIAFCLPGPSGTPLVALEPGRPHHRRLNLSARVEPVPMPVDDPAFDLPGSPDHRLQLLQALREAGLSTRGYRGWRCRMVYPVPLVEMQWAFRFGAAPR